MPEVVEPKVEKMTDDEREQAAAEAVGTGGETNSDSEEVMGFAPRDS